MCVRLLRYTCSTKNNFEKVEGILAVTLKTKEKYMSVGGGIKRWRFISPAVILPKVCSEVSQTSKKIKSERLCWTLFRPKSECENMIEPSHAWLRHHNIKSSEDERRQRSIVYTSIAESKDGDLRLSCKQLFQVARKPNTHRTLLCKPALEFQICLHV